MSNTTLTLISNDNHEFIVEKEVAIKSNTLKNMVDEDCVLTKMPLERIDSKTLALVIEFLCKNNADDQKKLVEDQEMSTLIELLNAANFLDIAEMTDFVAQRIADSIKDKSVEDVRQLLKIVNDYTPEEEQAYRDEYAWAFEI